MRTRARRGLRFWCMTPTTRLGLVWRSDRRKRRSLVQVEPLEGRALLAAVLIDALNNLSITGTAVNDNLTISVAGGTYTFNDTADVFMVTNQGSATVDGDGTSTLTASGIASIAVNTGAGDDTVNLQSTGV